MTAAALPPLERLPHRQKNSGSAMPASDQGPHCLPLEQINFEMLHISKLICRKMRFFAVSTLCYGALHSRAALEHLNFFKANML